MYKVKSPEEEAVERRRRAETARKARIFNTRQRVIGINIEDLNQQVHEKKLQQHMEKNQEEAYSKLCHDERMIFKSAKILISVFQ